MRAARALLAGAAVVVAATAFAGKGEARHYRFGCSVFDHHPCAPATCSVFQRYPCLPDYGYPIGQDLRLTIDSKSAYTKPDHDLDTIRDLFAALRACWTPPAPDTAQGGMEMSVRLAFKRSGEVIAPPRLTYATPGASADTRQVYRRAIDDAFARCTPMVFTRGLAGAIAGRPIAIRYVDNRDIQKPEHP